MTDAIKLDLINQAATLTGNSPITTLAGGTPIHTVADTNYDAIVEEELSRSHHWAEKTVALSKLAATSNGPNKYRWQKPSDVIEIKAVKYKPTGYDDDYDVTDYDLEGDFIRTRFDTGIYLNYVYRVDEAYWPPKFREVIRKRLEAAFRKGVNEEVQEGNQDEDRAFVLSKRARNSASRQGAPKKVYRGSALNRARRTSVVS